MASHGKPMARLNTLSIGGATFDLFMNIGPDVMHDCNGVRSFALPLGSKIRVEDVIGVFGGGAHNTAVALARLGCTAGFSGVLGSDQWGEAIQKNMEKESVVTRYLTVIENEPSSFGLILLSPGGERTILTHKGMDRHFHDVTFDREAAARVDCVYLNHIHKDSSVIEDDLINILVTTPDIHLTWNPGGRQIDAGLREENNRLLTKHTDLLLLNKEEALAFAGAKTDTEALRKLTAAGAAIVCITDGPNGSMAGDGKNIYRCPSLSGPVIDSTGAGDAFGSAMTWAVLSGKDLPTALKAGTIQAMSVVGMIGAQAGLLTQNQIQQKLDSTVIAVSSESF
jgi:sugar/nucleoside kinase (ribokinase family)